MEISMQGKRILMALLVSGAACVYAGSALADCMSVPNGWYLEGNVGSSKVSNLSYNDGNSSGIGGNVNIGYKFVPYFAAEIGGTKYANNSIQLNGVKIGKDQHYSYDLALRGIVPAGSTGFEAFAKVGVGRMVSNISPSSNLFSTSGISSSQHSESGLYIGAGGQYYFMPEMAVNIQWQRQNGNSSTGTGSLLSAGLSFIFD